MISACIFMQHLQMFLHIAKAREQAIMKMPTPLDSRLNVFAYVLLQRSQILSLYTTDAAVTKDNEEAEFKPHHSTGWRRNDAEQAPSQHGVEGK